MCKFQWPDESGQTTLRFFLRGLRGAIDTTLIAGQLLDLRGIIVPEDESYPDVVFDAMVVALSGRIFLDETVELTPEAVLRQIWEDHFILNPAAAAPG